MDELQSFTPLAVMAVVLWFLYGKSSKAETDHQKEMHIDREKNALINQQRELITSLLSERKETK